MNEQNRYWKTIVDMIQDGVMVVNPESTIISVKRGADQRLIRCRRKDLEDGIQLVCDHNGCFDPVSTFRIQARLSPCG